QRGVTGGGNLADETNPHRKRLVHLAQIRRHAALAAQAQPGTVFRQDVQARDLVDGDLSQRIEGRLQDLLDVETAADRLANRVEDLKVVLDSPAAVRRGTTPFARWPARSPAWTERPPSDRRGRPRWRSGARPRPARPRPSSIARRSPHA